MIQFEPSLISLVRRYDMLFYEVNSKASPGIKYRGIKDILIKFPPHKSGAGDKDPIKDLAASIWIGPWFNPVQSFPSG